MKQSLSLPLFAMALTGLIGLSACSSLSGNSETVNQEPETIIAEELSAPISLNDEEAVQSALSNNDEKTVTTFSADGTQTTQTAPEQSTAPTANNASQSLGAGCPRVQILSDAQSITYFDETNAIPTASDVIARASLSDIRGGCELTDKGLEVDLDMLMSGVIGKKGRFNGRDDLEAFMTFPYFVAVFDSQGRPYSKQILATAVRFDPFQERTDHAEKITQVIPIANQSNMGQFTITVGFQLNRRQLAYNKAQGLDSIRDTAPATPDVTTTLSNTPEGTEKPTAVSGKMEPIME